MPKRTYVALNNDGAAIGIVKSESESEAESFATRQLPGFIGCLEARSDSAEDVDALLTKVYRKAGMSESDARLKVLDRNSNDLRSYDLEELSKARSFANGGNAPTSADVDAILREGGLLPQRRGKDQSTGAGTDEARLESAFKGMGLSEAKARAATKGRRHR